MPRVERPAQSRDHVPLNDRKDGYGQDPSVADGVESLS